MLGVGRKADNLLQKTELLRNLKRQWPGCPKQDEMNIKDARKLGERNWRNAARNKDSWQKLLKKAVAQKELLCR